MKVIIDLIEDIRNRTANDTKFTLLAILLKENPNSPEDLQVVGEKAISGFSIDKSKKNLLLHIQEQDDPISTEPLLKDLNSLSNEAMMHEVKVSIYNQKKNFEVIGFGIAKEVQKYVIFLTT